MSKARHTNLKRCGTLAAMLLLLVGCSSIGEPVIQPSVYSLASPTDSYLSSVLTPLERDNPDLSGFHPLSDGKAALATRLLLMEDADHTLDLQYYIWHQDLTGKVMFNRVFAAADRGVRVRLLLDDMDTAGKDQTLRALDAHENIEVRLFNPFSSRAGRLGDYTTDTRRINRRMHNKTMTVDNLASIFGGRNIGDEYFGADHNVGFNDLDMLAIGPVVREISSQFDLYWNSIQVYPLSYFYPEPLPDDEVQQVRMASDEFIEESRDSKYADALRAVAEKQHMMEADIPFSWGEWELVYDLPSKVHATEVKKQTHLAPTLFEAMGRANKELLIVSPYFVPGDDFTEFLVELVSQGTEVKILTNSLAANDVPLVHSGYMRYREDLVSGGVELFEFKTTLTKEQRKELKKNSDSNAWAGSSRASLHGKFVGFDRRFLFVGSFNLDGRSVALNTELGVFFESPEFANRLAEAFNTQAYDEAYKLSLDSSDNLWWTTIDDGEFISVDYEPDTSWWTRSSTRFMSWFVPESQL